MCSNAALAVLPPAADLTSVLTFLTFLIFLTRLEILYLPEPQRAAQGVGWGAPEEIAMAGQTWP